jgi:predicted MFS family arabinose efflux permease
MGLQTSFIGLSGFVFLTSGGYLAEIEWQLPFALYLFALVILPMAAVYLTTPESIKKTNQDTSNTMTNYNWVGLLVAFFGMTSFYLLPTQLPFVLQRFESLSATDVGLVIASVTLATSFASLFYGKLKNALDFGDIFAIVFMLLGIGIGLIAIASTPVLIVAGAILAGIGTGWLMPNLNVWFVSQSTPESRGKIIGALTAALFLGQFTSPLLFAPLQALLGLKSAFLSVSLFLAILSAASIFVGMRKRKLIALQQGTVQ